VEPIPSLVPEILKAYTGKSDRMRKIKDAPSLIAPLPEEKMLASK